MFRLLIADLSRKNWDQCYFNQLTGKRYEDLKASDFQLLRKFESEVFPHLKDGMKPTLQNSYKPILDSFTDATFAAGTDEMVRSLAKNGEQVFYYHFDHVGSFSIADMFSSTQIENLLIIARKALGFGYESKKLGVCHADELLYLFCGSQTAKGNTVIKLTLTIHVQWSPDLTNCWGPS